MLAALRPILDAAANGLAVLIIHHNSRQGGEYRGSTAIGGAVDVILSMSEDATHSNRRDLKARSRFGGTPACLRVELQGNGFVGLGNPKASTRVDEQSEVLAVVNNEDGVARDAATGDLRRSLTGTRAIRSHETRQSSFGMRGEEGGVTPAPRSSAYAGRW